MAIEAKKSTDDWFPVMLLHTNATTPATAITAVTGWYARAGATTYSIYTIAGPQWVAYGSGAYAVEMGQGEFTQEDHYFVLIEPGDPSVLPYRFIADVADETRAELSDHISAIHDDTGTSGVQIAADQVVATVDVVSAIVGLNDPTVDAIADGVWTEDLTGHAAATDAATKVLGILDDTGTSGVQIATNQSVQTLGNLAVAARTQAASAVWAHNLSGYTAAAVTNATQAGEALRVTRQRLVGYGEWDDNLNRTFVYDQDETTVLVQLDHATTAPTTARTPS